MTCTFCAAARESPAHRVFDPLCIYCGARYFQLLRNVPAVEVADSMTSKPETRDQRIAWMERVLDAWEKQGHDRKRLRELGMAAVIPYEPVTGAAASDVDSPAPAKPKPKRKASTSRARAYESAGPSYEDAD